MLLKSFLATLGASGAGGAVLLAVSGFSAIPREPPPLHAAIGSVSLTVPGRLIREGSPHRATGNIELALAWPEFGPAARAAPGAPEPRQVFIGLKPSQQEPIAVSTASELYGPFFEQETWTHPSGLIVRRFRDASPFRDEDMYLAPPEGRGFYARCAKTGTYLETSAEHCLWVFSYKDMVVQARFSPELLGDWEALKAKTEELIAGIAKPQF